MKRAMQYLIGSIFILLCVGLMPVCKADEAFKIIVTPTKSRVHLNEYFDMHLQIRNETSVPQQINIMGGGWLFQWKASSPNVEFAPVLCSKDSTIAIKISPGESYTRLMGLFTIVGPINSNSLSFKMGFTSVGSRKTYWSDDVTMGIMQ